MGIWITGLLKKIPPTPLTLQIPPIQNHLTTLCTLQKKALARWISTLPYDLRGKPSSPLPPQSEVAVAEETLSYNGHNANPVTGGYRVSSLVGLGVSSILVGIALLFVQKRKE